MVLLVFSEKKKDIVFKTKKKLYLHCFDFFPSFSSFFSLFFSFFLRTVRFVFLPNKRKTKERKTPKKKKRTGKSKELKNNESEKQKLTNFSLKKKIINKNR